MVREITNQMSVIYMLHVVPVEMVMVAVMALVVLVGGVGVVVEAVMGLNIVPTNFPVEMVMVWETMITLKKNTNINIKLF